MGASGEALPDIASSGWYVAATWVLTGEHKDGRVDPESSVFGGGIGALELIARAERLSFAPAATAPAPVSPLVVMPAANADRVTTLGLAWYLNRHLKITGSAVFESIVDPERSPVAHSSRVPTAVIQFQVGI
jgi:phosphate-selective porin